MSTNEVERALALPEDERGAALARIPEDQWLERKSVRVAPKDFAHPLVALANAEGGVVVVGLHGGGVEGIKAHAARVNALLQTPMDFTRPPVRTHFEQVTCRNDDGDVDALLIARVSPGDVLHETAQGECFLRVGDESRKLGFAARQELHYDRGSAPYDGQPIAGVTVQDLDAQALEEYRRAAGATDTHARLLQARSLLTSSSKVTVAGYLLFARHPQERLPHAHVRVLRYRDVDRGTGRRLSLDDAADVRIEGSIPRVIERAAANIDEWVPRRRALDDAGRFEGVPIVPRDAWLEGLVNAVIHRSYSVHGDHVRVEIFPDRVEIESPGRFPGLADPRRPMEIARFARNPRIARACADLRIGQELGEGIKRMFDEMRLDGLTDPAYTQTQGSVRLILRSESRIAPAVARSLPQGSLSLLDLMRSARQPLGTGQLVELSGLSRPTVKRQLDALQGQGIIVWEGKSDKDPRATWRLA